VRRFAVIGGTGITQLAGLQLVDTHNIDTPYGSTSKEIVEGRVGECAVFFLQRHGAPLAIPPHKINYRANLWALKSLAVSDVVAINAVGGITPDMATGALVIPDQIIDYTWGRKHSVDDGSNGELQHIDFSHPFTPLLRAELLRAAVDKNIPCLAPATLGVTQGPRLESAAEIVRMERDGCDLVGMTSMPEAALALELGMAYAALCMVVNPAAGKSDQPISLQGMRESLSKNAAVVATLLAYLLSSSASA